MRRSRFIATIFVALTALAASQFVLAQSDTGINAREFGLGQPQSIAQLPASQLRERLETLPPQASAKALRWLQEFSFPATDVHNILVDDQGSVFYSDTFLPDPEAAGTASGTPTSYADVPTSTLDDVFLLHSKPGASNTVIVDFDGHVITGTAWNNGNAATLYALPYNTEGDTNSFTTAERKKMVDIWHRIAEDLSPYDIDVTTQEPTSLNSSTGRILITHGVDQNGNPVHECAVRTTGACGGVAYVGVFGYSNYHTYYSPALVFYNKLGGGFEHYVAEAASHELGHNLGLSHDGTSSVGYYTGHGSGAVSWAPIMGVGYYNNVTQWSKGEYAGANNTQDDLAIIDGRLGYDFDDHGDTRATAGTLVVDNDGTVLSSNPALDPHNELLNNKGVIGSRDDVDVLSFVAGAGTVSLSVRPAWDAFYRSTNNYRGANLDIEAELQDKDGITVATNDPTTETSASISTTVSAGTYYLLVTGVENATVPYSDYGSLGQYFIDGSVPPSSPDNTPPTPDPMTWASAPVAISDSAISMTATTATDETSAVQYQFRCVTGGAGCLNSAWQSGTSHTATGLAASTQYVFQVVARDQAGNETTPSVTASATTAAPPPPPADPTNLSAVAASDSAIDLSWTDNAGDETGYRVQRFIGSSFQTIATLGANATSYNDSGLAASTTYDYRVAAFRNSDFSAYATASGTTEDPPPFTNYIAISDAVVAGSVSGGVSDTQSDDGSVQSITERESGGKPANRHTYLEHRWNFNVSAGATVTVYANAWRAASDEDTFDFEYSTNGGNSFQTLFNVSATNTDNLQSASIPGSPSGSIIIRVIDTDQTQGERSASTVFVDHLFIQVGNPSNDPLDGGPTVLNATASSSSQIDLVWSSDSSNEAGFLVERSPDGSTGWEEIADLPAGSTAYSDTGLAELTQYFYRVSAYNAVNVSGYAEDNATTTEAPAISLTASGYKSKGKHGVLLEWTGADPVEIYLDDTKLPGTFSGGAYDNFIGAKGGATYTHKVCVVGSSTDCSNVTTTVF